VKKRAKHDPRPKVRRSHEMMVRWELVMEHYPLWLTLYQQSELTERLLAYGVVAPLDAGTFDPRIRAVDMLPGTGQVISEERVAASLSAAEGTPVFAGFVAGKKLTHIEHFLNLATFHRGLSFTFAEPVSS
jgi:hypothetical protein